jgi:hypothetical protein
MAREVTKYDDVIDSRDVIERIEELEREISEADEARESDTPTGFELMSDEIDALRVDLAALKALEQEASSSPDWAYGETLIRDSYFERYAEELADEIGAIDPNLAGRWPYTCIDWEAAARDLQQDYQQVDFDGVTYWIRY